MHWRLLLASKFYKIIPQQLLNSYHPFLAHLFSIQNPDNKKLLKEIINDSDPVLVRWALGQIDNFTPVEPQIGY